MQIPSRSSLSRWLRAVGAASLLLVLAGCNLQITDLTPKVLAENPSRIYNFSMRATNFGQVDPRTVVATIVLDGQSHRLQPSPLGKGIYEFEYQLPPGRDEVKYYYLVQYKVATGGGLVDRESYTDVMTARVVGRYVLSLETNRGPVGAKISVVGRGFGAGDTIKFDDQPVATSFESANAISFHVPSVQPGRNYRVTLEGAAGSSPVGTFRVDASSVDIQPSSLTLNPGGFSTLTFNIGAPAPAGGQLLDVTTDVPESVIMPEVIVPEGLSSTTVNVKGGKPGSGALYLKGYGPSGELSIPVTVR